MQVRGSSPRQLEEVVGMLVVVMEIKVTSGVETKALAPATSKDMAEALYEAM